jgi:hypothetical protein
VVLAHWQVAWVVAEHVVSAAVLAVEVRVPAAAGVLAEQHARLAEVLVVFYPTSHRSASKVRSAKLASVISSGVRLKKYRLACSMPSPSQGAPWMTMLPDSLSSS